MSDRRRRGFTLQWHITDRCNLRCRHCYRDDGAAPDELAPEAAARLLDHLLGALEAMRVAPHLALTGGEPLATPDLLFFLLDAAWERYRQGPWFNVGLMTNGTLVDDGVAARLARYRPMLASFQVSLDGSTAAINDAIRGRGAFAGAVAGIAALRRASPAALSISFTVQRRNIDDLDGIMRLGEQLGVGWLHVARFAPLGRGQTMTEDAQSPLTADDARRAIEFLYRRNRENAAAMKRGEKKPRVVEDRTLFHLADPRAAVRRLEAAAGNEGRLGNACAIGVATATVLSDGTLLPCRRLPLPLGNLINTPFVELWGTSEVLWDFRLRQRRVKGKCRACEFLTRYPGLCSGGAACVAYATLGDYNRPDPHCWHEPEGGAPGGSVG